jgi:hypothetical protein
MKALPVTAGTLAAIALLWVGMATPAYAIDSGPNNGIAEAEGPLSGGVEYTGTIGTSNDIDTYLFYVSGEVALDVHVANISGTCLSVMLGNTDNSKRLDSASYLKEGNNADLTYTTSPGVSRFYLQFEGSCYPKETGAYSFSISPPGAIISGPATPTAQPVSGLHENSGQAFGPLAANTAYSDALLTSNDQNWLTFFTPASAEPVDIEATALVDKQENCGHLSIDHTELSLAGNEWTHYTFTSASSAQHFISNETCVSWEVIVKTPSLAPGLQTPLPEPPPPPPPSPSNACLHDRANLAKAQLLVRSYRHKLASHHLSHKARRKYRQGLSHASGLVKRYATLRYKQCPGGR